MGGGGGAAWGGGAGNGRPQAPQNLVPASIGVPQKTQAVKVVILLWVSWRSPHGCRRLAVPGQSNVLQRNVTTTFWSRRARKEMRFQPFEGPGVSANPMPL